MEKEVRIMLDRIYETMRDTKNLLESVVEAQRQDEIKILLKSILETQRQIAGIERHRNAGGAGGAVHPPSDAP